MPAAAISETGLKRAVAVCGAGAFALLAGFESFSGGGGSPARNGLCSNFPADKEIPGNSFGDGVELGDSLESTYIYVIKTADYSKSLLSR